MNQQEGGVRSFSTSVDEICVPDLLAIASVGVKSLYSYALALKPVASKATTVIFSCAHSYRFQYNAIT